MCVPMLATCTCCCPYQTLSVLQHRLLQGYQWVDGPGVAASCYEYGARRVGCLYLVVGCEFLIAVTMVVVRWSGQVGALRPREFPRHWPMPGAWRVGVYPF